MNASIKKIECEVCHKTFPNMYRLNEHAVAHSVDRPFECEICGNLFKSNSTLRQHMIVHTGTATFECSVCENYIWLVKRKLIFFTYTNFFSRRKNLKYHMKHVHGLVGDQLDIAIEKSINKKAAEVENGETEKEPRPQLHNFFPMSATYSEDPLVKNVKIEDHSQPFSTLLDAIKLEEYENQLVTPKSTSLKDQNQSPAAEVSTSKSVTGSHQSQLPQQESFEKSRSVRQPPLLSDHMDLNSHIHPTSKRKECKICGDIPVGYNYGVLTCEGCKIFFQSYYHRHAELKCRMHSTCFSKKNGQKLTQILSEL
ncbi:hypothetical protein CRE_14561 [Caenorhabditis remanei]|uniref:Uncharacterized protein n=1 Tax=Caenorhabditis remanei TaxID=31234 RepID=E3M9I9_CAERE|nr:hypothetical protein CRE_14561 [Caenorhabditis remanei]